MPMGESLVGRAVRQLAQSVELVDEAVVHLRQAESSAVNAFALYRQAADEVTMPEVLDAIERSEHAVDVLRGVMATLAAAKEAVRDYVALIAPGLAFSDGKGVRDTPSGADFSEGPSRTHGRAGRARDAFLRRADETADAAASIQDTAQEAVYIVRPPEITGVGHVVDSRPVATSTPPAIAEPVSSLVLTGVFAVEAVSWAVRRTVASTKRLFRRDDEEY